MPTGKLRLSDRLANAEILQRDAFHIYSSGTIAIDENGRTPMARYHYWCGVVDTYRYLVSLEDA
jgi:hypothetical protein